MGRKTVKSIRCPFGDNVKLITIDSFLHGPKCLNYYCSAIQTLFLLMPILTLKLALK